MSQDDALRGVSAVERAEIEAMLSHHAEDEGEAGTPYPRSGPVKRLLRALAWLICLGAIGVIGWHWAALGTIPDTPNDGVHAPLVLTLALGGGGVLLLLLFNGKWQRGLLFLVGLGLLGLCGLSMRWIDSSRAGVREHWAGLERQVVKLPGDLCYRLGVDAFELRGAGPARFVYKRGTWPSAFSDLEFRRYFFSDAPLRTTADGWNCPARD
ncbi:hypothetical protein [Sphingomonas sp.]|uniref:hypothetical protein n=1 Tax=Sphingomonas sp. TaxID=28214 RepID=UPI001B15A113|nr:hypothetical protein [Sphingomonas sp.]MBO9711966.1 hypothetical protein [Sphingomonas sp.]